MSTQQNLISPPNISTQEQRPSVRKSKTWLLITGGITLAIILFVFLASVFIAQKQKPERNVAPNAPASLPKASQGNDICNLTVVAITPTPTPTNTPTLTPTPAPECNQACSSDDYCQRSNLEYICYLVNQATNDKRCRLKDNPTNEQCVAPTNTPTPTPVGPMCSNLALLNQSGDSINQPIVGHSYQLVCIANPLTNTRYIITKQGPFDSQPIQIYDGPNNKITFNFDTGGSYNFTCQVQPL